ncbi:hypothetical protein Zm00014a_021337 [Zea mays]|uniref:Beta-glucosidase 11 n=1 Tax=Zea mays TaxID=4577 RepID=A0A3L6FI52_MAIZE|nr:hypothetical protein Zm00014a_021337 [Zea mays]
MGTFPSISKRQESLFLSCRPQNSSSDSLRSYATTNGSLHDTDRVDYMKTHISSTLAALRNGANVKGYFAWCFLDVFEYLSGFMSQYGLYRVDFEDEALPRQARLSARWYSKFLENKGIHVEGELDDAGSHVEQ